MSLLLFEVALLTAKLEDGSRENDYAGIDTHLFH